MKSSRSARRKFKSPKKNIPRAVFLSLLIVIPIYLLVAVAALGSVHPGNLTPWDYLAFTRKRRWSKSRNSSFVGGGVMILFGGLISTMSALNATIYSSSRVAFAMGRDRNFPSIFSRVHEKKLTPHWAIVFSLCIVVFMAISLPIEDVASSADIMFLLLFLQVNLAVISLRKKRPDLDRGFIIPLFPWLSILGIVLLLSLALYMFAYSPKAWIVTASWVAAGLVVYKSYASKREVEHVRKGPRPGAAGKGRVSHSCLCLAPLQGREHVTARRSARQEKQGLDHLPARRGSGGR